MTVMQVFEGSDGQATKDLYVELEMKGPEGVIAINLFRACKCSWRAKKYYRKVFTGLAYGRKVWSLQNLCDALAQHGEALGFVWGWKKDHAQAVHCWVLYVDIPGIGQASFHNSERLDVAKRRDYKGEWHGLRMSHKFIVAYVIRVLGRSETVDLSVPPPAQPLDTATLWDCLDALPLPVDDPRSTPT